MTMLQERPTIQVVQPRAGFTLTEKEVGWLGLAAVAVGTWIYAIPTDWFLGGLAEGWYLGMFGGGGVMMAGAFGFAARRALGGEHGGTGPR